MQAHRNTQAHVYRDIQEHTIDCTYYTVVFDMPTSSLITSLKGHFNQITKNDFLTYL